MNDKNIVLIEGILKVKQDDVVATFCDKKKLAKYIDTVKKEVSKGQVNLKTDAGRKQIASSAFKVSKVKTALTKVLDTSLTEAKALIKSAGEGKKFLSEELDKLRDETRLPLTQWEQEEETKNKARIEEIKLKIQGIAELSLIPVDADKDHLTSMIDAVEHIDCSEGFDEFAQAALQQKAKTKEILSEALNSLIQKEIAEQQRLQVESEKKDLKIQERLNNLKMIPMDFLGKPSLEVQKKIDSLTSFEVPVEEFGERHEEAIESVKTVIDQLTLMHTQQLSVEEAQRSVTIETQHQANIATPITSVNTTEKADLGNVSSLSEVIAKQEPVIEAEPTQEVAASSDTGSAHLDTSNLSTLLWGIQQLQIPQCGDPVNQQAVNECMTLLNQAAGTLTAAINKSEAA